MGSTFKVVCGSARPVGVNCEFVKNLQKTAPVW